MRGRMLSLGFVGALAMASIAVPVAIQKQIPRAKEAAPFGPNISRQVRRKLERERMKRGKR